MTTQAHSGPFQDHLGTISQDHIRTVSGPLPRPIQAHSGRIDRLGFDDVVGQDLLDQSPQEGAAWTDRGIDQQGHFHIIGEQQQQALFLPLADRAVCLLSPASILVIDETQRRRPASVKAIAIGDRGSSLSLRNDLPRISEGPGHIENFVNGKVPSARTCTP